MSVANYLANKLEDTLGNKPVSTGSSQPRWSETETMHALVWKGKEKVEYCTVPKPLVSAPQDALIRVTATTICGSDLHLYTAEAPNMREGDILGHETLGIVEDVGPEVKTLRKGQRVVVAFGITCGQCDYCKRGEYTCCDTTNPSKVMETLYGHRITGVFGYGHVTGGYPGGQAEYLRVPFADNNCLPLPDEIPDEKALFISDIACTSLHACQLGEVREGCSVAIWGLGPVGLLALEWAKVLGAKKIIGIDVVPERLQLAKEKLDVEVINAKEVSDVVKTIFELCPGGVDVAIDCAGFRYATTWLHTIQRALMLETDSPDILSQCIYAVRKSGNVSIIGDYFGFANQFPIGAMMEKHLTVRGGQCFVQGMWKYVLEMMLKNKFDPKIAVNYHGRLSEGPELYKKFHLKEEGIVKVFLRP